MIEYITQLSEMLCNCYRLQVRNKIYLNMETNIRACGRGILLHSSNLTDSIRGHQIILFLFFLTHFCKYATVEFMLSLQYGQI